ncbi:hypothetical protein IAU60_000822 [Kwoniella sp. DSM 27419]
MAPYSPLPGTSNARTLVPPHRYLSYGQNLSPHHPIPQPVFDRTRGSSKTQPKNGQTRQGLFDFDHLSLGVLLCLFLMTLCLLATFSTASLSGGMGFPAEASNASVEASTWGEVGLYELGGWRKVRAGESLLSGSRVHPKDHFRMRRNEAVLEALAEKMKEGVYDVQHGHHLSEEKTRLVSDMDSPIKERDEPETTVDNAEAPDTNGGRPDVASTNETTRSDLDPADSEDPSPDTDDLKDATGKDHPGQVRRSDDAGHDAEDDDDQEGRMLEARFGKNPFDSLCRGPKPHHPKCDAIRDKILKSVPADSKAPASSSITDSVASSRSMNHKNERAAVPSQIPADEGRSDWTAESASDGGDRSVSPSDSSDNRPWRDHEDEPAQSVEQSEHVLEARRRQSLSDRCKHYRGHRSFCKPKAKPQAAAAATSQSPEPSSSTVSPLPVPSSSPGSVQDDTAPDSNASETDGAESSDDPAGDMSRRNEDADEEEDEMHELEARRFNRKCLGRNRAKCFSGKPKGSQPLAPQPSEKPSPSAVAISSVEPAGPTESPSMKNANAQDDAAGVKPETDGSTSGDTDADSAPMTRRSADQDNDSDDDNEQVLTRAPRHRRPRPGPEEDSGI